MRITIMLMVLFSAVMIADPDAVMEIRGDAYVFGESAWDGYFTILFRDAETFEDLHFGEYYNETIFPDYIWAPGYEVTVNMLCILYSPTGHRRAAKVFLGVTTNPPTELDIYFEPNCIAIKKAIDTWTNATVLLPEPLSLGGATWAQIKALDF